jgi:hypothetical protein
MALMAAAMGHEGGLLLLAVAGFVPIANYRSFDEVLLMSDEVLLMRLCGWCSFRNIHFRNILYFW